MKIFIKEINTIMESSDYIPSVSKQTVFTP